MTIFPEISEDDVEKFRPLLDRSIDDVKQELQSLVMNYYESLIRNDTKLLNSTVAKLNEYLEFDISDINEYLNYCLVIATNEIIKKISDVDSIYVPKNPDLQFRTKYVKDNENHIKYYGLDESEIELLTQYIKEKHEIYCLSLIMDGNLVSKLKPKTQIPQELAKTVLVNTNYIRNEDIKKSGELYFAIDKAFGIHEK